MTYLINISLNNKKFLHSPQEPWRFVKGESKARIALATSKDFKKWEKHGIVGPQHTKSKAACLFPEKINGKYTMLYIKKNLPHSP